MTDREFVMAYRWLDRHGQKRSVDILADADAQVWAYASKNDGTPVLIGFVDANGKFSRLAQAQAIEYGMDTAAAWNDLIELCRQAHLART